MGGDPGIRFGGVDLGFGDTADSGKDADEMSEWISVKERLPEEGQCVLVTDGESLCTRQFFPAGSKYTILCNEPTWGAYGWNGYEWEFDIYPQERITHWMPLPEPPKEEK